MQTATDIANQIVCTYGMDKEFGMAMVNPSQISDYSSMLEIRRHINEILDNEYKKAKNIFEANRDVIDDLVKQLLAKNHLGGEKAQRFFHGKKNILISLLETKFF